MRTSLSFICPYVDPGIAIILAIVLIKEPIEMILDSLRSLVLFAPDKEIKDKIEEISKSALSAEGCEITAIEVIKTGRKIWAEIYFLPAGNTIDLVRLKELDRRINETAKAEFDSVYIDLLPDMEEYRVVPVEEVKARRNELIRYMEEEDERKALKEERKNQKRQKKQ